MEGDVCLLKNGSTGICRMYEDCKKAFSFPKNPPNVCSIRGDTEVICCPPGYNRQREHYNDTETCSLLVERDPKQTKESLSGKACRMYSDTYMDNRESSNLIGGSDVTDISEYPFMVALNTKNEKNVTETEYSCGGALISDRFVLTAAHCEGSFSIVKVRMGALNLAGLDRDAREYDVEKFIAHPCYRMNEPYYDIALVKLWKAVEISNYIFPACIYMDPEIDLNEQYRVTGWGSTNIMGFGKSASLLVASLKLQDPNDCADKWDSDPTAPLPRKYAKNTMICSRNPEKGATCKGDSGGPISLESDKIQHTIVAVVSQAGSGCGDEDRPDIFTKIYPFLLWIEDVIWPNGNITPLEWHD